LGRKEMYLLWFEYILQNPCAGNIGPSAIVLGGGMLFRNN
jgi:hypothetical protein